MNPLLDELVLAAIERLGHGAGRGWSDFAIVNSVGPVPMPDLVRGGWQAERGFNVLLTRGSRLPAYFGKCRDTSDEAFARETALLEQLGASPAARDILPKAVGVSRGRVRLQLSTFLAGTPLSVGLRQLSNGQWEAALHGVIRTAGRLGRAATEAVPGFLPRETELSLAAECRPGLASLAEAGVGADSIAAIERGLAAGGMVPAQPQHGDLWASNVLRTRDRWVLLDLEFFGVIRVPLYDGAHLVKSTAQFRATPPDPWDAPRSPWSSLLLRDGAEGGVSRRVLSAAATQAGLSREASVACVMFYLCDITARLVSQQTPGKLLAPALRELEAFAGMVRDETAARVLGFA